MAGAQLIHDVGYMDNGKTGSLVQLVICHELIGWIKQFIKPLAVDDVTLALGDVKRVVDEEGDFLMSENTLNHYREDFYPELLDRMNCEGWVEAGRADFKERARKKVVEILACKNGGRGSGRSTRTESVDPKVREKLRELAYG
jgi:trimethylamine--corrinoid protein Co-methyltransferase